MRSSQGYARPNTKPSDFERTKETIQNKTKQNKNNARKADKQLKSKPAMVTSFSALLRACVTCRGGGGRWGSGRAYPRVCPSSTHPYENSQLSILPTKSQQMTIRFYGYIHIGASPSVRSYLMFFESLLGSRRERSQKGKESSWTTLSGE